MLSLFPSLSITQKNFRKFGIMTAIYYARIYYESLSHSSDTESEDLANAAESLAKVIS
jgi:hypothetical protein